MFSPLLRKHYESLLQTILGSSPEKGFKSSMLLQAYATFSAMTEISDPLSDAYTIFCQKYADYKYACLQLKEQQCEALQRSIISEYINLPLLDFLQSVTPDIVCDSQKLIEYWDRSESGLDIVQFIHHVFSIKRNSYQEITPSQSHGKEDAFKAIYHNYAAREASPLPESDFKLLYSVINLYELNTDELLPKHIGTTKKQLFDLRDILFRELGLSRSESFQMVRDYFCDNAQADEIADKLQVYNFTKTKDNKLRVKLVHKVLALMAKFSPLELICSISIHKKEGAVNERNKTEASVLPNDITLENSLIYSLFFSEIAAKTDSNIAVLFPSPHFVRKILLNTEHKNPNITFVFGNKNIADTLSFQANDNTSNPQIGTNTRFVGYQEWLETNISVQPYSHVLLFGTQLDIINRVDLSTTLPMRCITDGSLLVFEPSQYIENGNIGSWDNEKTVTKKIGLIPQGINNSTQPRRKVVLKCIINPSFMDERSKPIELHTYTLNTVMKTQGLSPMHEAPVLVDRKVLHANPHSLRQLYSKEMSLRHPAGRERTPSFSHEITPDIVVWCSKTYNANDQPRLQAYVCEPAHSSKINSGFAERGAMLKSTVKHTTSVADEDILDWLENIYPFSVVSPRRSSKNANTSASPIVTNIQEEIIAHYTEYLSGQNIALKTLWYLYPSLADCYNPSSYDIFSSMMKTAIGEQRVQDLTAEICEALLVSTYPDLSVNSLWTRFEMISTALDYAVALGYCQANALRQALRQAHIHDRLFGQVRNALTKKHFTQHELLQAYDFLFKRLELKQHQYLGVLIRLATGLESKIVCALRWSDLIRSAQFHHYSIIIARKMKDDGSFEGFHDNEDYLSFPVPEKLQSVLLQLKSQHNIKNDNQLILDSILSSDCGLEKITPKILNQLTREMVLHLGIDERIVSLPHHENQEHETDLNKYNGDIIRENFRFWATKAAMLNNDELSYLLRTKPTSTLGCYYCDFLNEASQLAIHVKLNRIDAAIHQVSASCQRHKPLTSSCWRFETTINNAAKTAVSMELLAEKETDVKISVNSQYGVSYEITPLREEGI